MILGSVEPDGSAATLKIMVNPMMMWIWIGGLIITLGALITIIPGRPVRPSMIPTLEVAGQTPAPPLEYSGSR
jgi:cytochrome c biogenesis factor